MLQDIFKLIEYTKVQVNIRRSKHMYYKRDYELEKKKHRIGSQKKNNIEVYNKNDDTTIVDEGNSFYEIDLNCMKRKSGE